jgi:CubicO group peptidase (beta-lactamase class C family)
MKTKMKAIFMAMGMLLTFFSVSAQSKSSKIDSLMKSFYDKGQFSGVVTVGNKGKIVYESGFGDADRAAHIPNRSNTKINIASITKPFTAVLVMQLVEAGKIKPENTLDVYLPGLKDEVMRKVTIHQLLSHTSGIPDFVDASLITEKDLTATWFTDQLNKISPQKLTGGVFKYANSTYVMLAFIIEKLTGLPYAECLKKNIFDKCGMTSSGSLLTKERIKGNAKGYIKKDGVITEASYTNASVYKGAGSIYSTVQDMFKFDQALYTEKLLSSKYRDMMYTTNGNYAYGWFVRPFPGIGKVVYHEGGIPGYTGLLFRAIEKEQTVILLSNNESDDPYKQQITRGIINILNQ